MVYEILALIITLVIIIVAFYLVKLFKDLQIFLRGSMAAVERIEIQVASLKTETIPLLRGSHELIEKVNLKMDDVDPLFKTVSNVGAYLNDKTDNLLALEKKKRGWQNAASEILDLVSVGIKIFQQFQNRR